MLRTPALIAIAIGALMLTATPAVASKPPPGQVDALARDLGITQEQAVNRMASEARGNLVVPSLRKRLGDRYAGAWYEGPEAALVVASVSASDSAAITGSGAQARTVTRSFAQLLAVKNGLDHSPAPSSVFGWGVTPQDNAVTVSASDADQALAWARSSGVDTAAVKVTVAQERPRLFYDIRGGDAYYIPSKGYRCSIGFAARRGTQVGYTSAGHCGSVGDATNGSNQVAQGTFQISSFPTNDYSWVATNSNWTAPGVVNGYSAGILPVHGSTVTQPGGSICRSGSTSQWHCGTVQALNQTVNYAEGTVYELTRTNVCAEPGDSGGAFISGDQAQGMTSGGSGDCTSGGTTYFQPINEILSTGGLTLITSGSQPPTGCSGYREHYSGSLSSGQSGYQPNGSYYQSTVSGTHAACLKGPAGTDFDLYLQKWNGSSWAVVATSNSPNPDETISYSGTAGYYRYRVHAYSGSGSYTLDLNRP
ncbi:S1 family peptidase [Nonomuraea sediminis]|uniref:S1 family peptidase n=1 Tax=Nonomuraea sediminis TaxID=2835864 RepID=UPI001BDD8643|nr:S1 family peptidase [Nonomuraea sediminis]